MNFLFCFSMTRLLTHWPCQVVVQGRPGWAQNPPDLAGRHSSLLSSPTSPQLASRRTSRRWRSHEIHLILKRRCFYMVIPWRYQSLPVLGTLAGAAPARRARRNSGILQGHWPARGDGGRLPGDDFYCATGGDWAPAPCLVRPGRRARAAWWHHTASHECCQCSDPGPRLSDRPSRRGGSLP